MGLPEESDPALRQGRSTASVFSSVAREQERARAAAAGGALQLPHAEVDRVLALMGGGSAYTFVKGEDREEGVGAEEETPPRLLTADVGPAKPLAEQLLEHTRRETADARPKEEPTPAVEPATPP